MIVRTDQNDGQNQPDSKSQSLRHWVDRVTLALNVLGSLLIVAVMVLVNADVIGRGCLRLANIRRAGDGFPFHRCHRFSAGGTDIQNGAPYPLRCPDGGDAAAGTTHAGIRRIDILHRRRGHYAAIADCLLAAVW